MRRALKALAVALGALWAAVITWRVVGLDTRDRWSPDGPDA